MLKELKEKMKKDKLKAITIIVAIVVFVIGIVMTVVNTGDTYALTSTYTCPLGGTGPIYMSPYKPYCLIEDTILNAQNACKSYLSQEGYEYADYTSAKGCPYIAVSVVTSYTIVYNSTGGSGTPSSQTKEVGASLKLSINEPIKNGYEFMGWSTSSSATNVDYEPGDTLDDELIYNENGIAVLYAVWGYRIVYNSTGGSGTPSSQTKIVGANLKLRLDEPVKDGSTFLGWSKSSSAASVNYEPGDTLTEELSRNENGIAVLYAVWSSGSGSGTTTPDSGNTGEDNTGSGTTTPDSGNTGGDSTGSGTTTPEIYTVSYDVNGGTGTIASQTKTEGTDLKLSTTKPNRTGYTFLGWNNDKNATTAKYSAGGTYKEDAAVTLYAIWKANEYKITYELNSGNISDSSNTGTYDKEVVIKNPIKNVIVIVNDNDMDATIGAEEKVNLTFEGWTSSNINTSTAYYGEKLWSNGSTKVTDTKFKNLTTTAGATVTLAANWKDKNITLPIVVKHGYNCYINTKADGKGTSYESGGAYTVKANSSQSINLYAICEPLSKTDEDISEGPGTGDALIYTVWVIGVGALGYSVYYFMKRKNSL